MASGFEEIKDKMFSNADGMFLWVRLKVKDFKEIGSVEDIMEALQDTTEDLDQLYQQAIRRILGRSRFVRDRALKAILWVTNSYRLLSKSELLDALSMKPGRKGLTESQRLSHELPLCTECADLIVEVDGCYQLLHASLREFLLSNHLTLQTYGDLQLEAHAILSETCLTYPSFNEFCHASAPTPTELTKLRLQYPLLEYAATYWGNHFRSADGKRTS